MAASTARRQQVARGARTLPPTMLLLAVIVVSLCATAATAAEGGHVCIHDRIRANQLKGRTLNEMLAAGYYRAHATYEVPRARLVDGASGRAGDSDWQPIRIAVFAEDVWDSSKYCSAEKQSRPTFEGGMRECTNDDILTDKKRDLLLNTMIPAAIKMHEDRLSVQPLALITTDTYALVDPTCRSFTVPENVSRDGVTGADFVILVAAGPISGSTVAWATTCAYATDLRPLIGVINVKPQYIDGSEQSTRTMAHEILHSLGFSGPMFQQHGMTYTTAGLRGKPTASLIASGNVTAEARKHYGCSTQLGMEVDDSGGQGTAGSHWNVRNAKDDLMCGYVGPAMKYSAMTIAAMEDLGYYKGNYDNAEVMVWGKDVGCGLQDSKCVISGVSQIPSMFCANINSQGGPLQCTSDRHSLGYCDISQYNMELPLYYQYFSDPTLGGSNTADFCPVITRYSNTGCTSGDRRMMPNSVISPSSRCFDKASGSTLTNAICAEVQCDDANKQYRVKFANSPTYVACPAGTTVTASTSSSTMPSGSTVTCPSYDSLCPLVEDPSNEGDRAVTRSVVAAWAAAALLAVVSISV